jgi:hypothetical protein
MHDDVGPEITMKVISTTILLVLLTVSCVRMDQHMKQVSRPFAYLPVLLAYHSVEGHWPPNTKEFEGFVNARGFDLKYEGFTNLLVTNGNDDVLQVEYDLTPPLSGHCAVKFSASSMSKVQNQFSDKEIREMLETIGGK